MIELERRRTCDAAHEGAHELLVLLFQEIRRGAVDDLGGELGLHAGEFFVKIHDQHVQAILALAIAGSDGFDKCP